MPPPARVASVVQVNRLGVVSADLRRARERGRVARSAVDVVPHAVSIRLREVRVVRVPLDRAGDIAGREDVDVGIGVEPCGEDTLRTAAVAGDDAAREGRLSTTYSYGHDPVLDENVPRVLAQRFCAGNCVVTKNYSLLEPGLFARKYYARGVGTILEVENTGEVVQLVNCNFDRRCANLPTP